MGYDYISKICFDFLKRIIPHTSWDSDSCHICFYIYLLTAGGFTDERMCRYIEKPGGGGTIPNGTLLPVCFREKKSRASYKAPQ